MSSIVDSGKKWLVLCDKCKKQCKKPLEKAELERGKTRCDRCMLMVGAFNLATGQLLKVGRKR